MRYSMTGLISLAVALTLHMTALYFCEKFLCGPASRGNHVASDSTLRANFSARVILNSSAERAQVETNVAADSFIATRGNRIAHINGPMDASGFNQKQYSTSEYLDTRATPLTDWRIVWQVLPKNVISTLIFTVWVSEAGGIDHFEIGNDVDRDPWAALALSELLQTEMEPATVDNQRVSSTMTVELVVDNTR